MVKKFKRGYQKQITQPASSSNSTSGNSEGGENQSGQVNGSPEKAFGESVGGKQKRSFSFQMKDEIGR